MSAEVWQINMLLLWFIVIQTHSCAHFLPHFFPIDRCITGIDRFISVHHVMLFCLKLLHHVCLQLAFKRTYKLNNAANDAFTDPTN